jgi:hypothetical protein
MMTTEQGKPARATVAQRWLARGAVIAAGASALDWKRPRRMALTGPGTGRG